MLHIDAKDYLSDFEMDPREDYPDEVLEAEWNPVVAQLQLLKRRKEEQQPSSSPRWLYAIDDGDTDR